MLPPIVRFVKAPVLAVTVPEVHCTALDALSVWQYTSPVVVLPSGREPTARGPGAKIMCLLVSGFQFSDMICVGLLCDWLALVSHESMLRVLLPAAWLVFRSRHPAVLLASTFACK